MERSSQKLRRFLAPPCKKAGYEALEDALKLALGSNPAYPLSPRDTAAFRTLLARCNRARATGRWSVRCYTVGRSRQVCVHMDDFRKWAQAEQPDFGRGELISALVGLEKRALDVLRYPSRDTGQRRRSIFFSRSQTEKKRLLVFAARAESALNSSVGVRLAARVVQELPILFDEISSTHPNPWLLAQRVFWLSAAMPDPTAARRLQAERGKKGGVKRKPNPLVQEAVNSIVSEIVTRGAEPTEARVRDKLTGYTSANPYEYDGGELYVDEDRLYWKDEQGKSGSLALNSLGRYVKRAKKT